MALHWLGVEALLYRNILLYTPRLEVKAQAVDQFSVVILLIDSMSSQSLVRWLPLTKSYLDSEGGFLFSGHSRVGTNSYPNVLSILSGGYSTPWVQNMLRQHSGYLTMFLLDAPRLQGHRLGFMDPPADIYHRAPFLARDEEEPGDDASSVSTGGSR